MQNKQISDIGLNAIISGSEMKEKTVNENIEETVIARVRKRKEYRNFSVNFEIDDYNKFMLFLNENNINSGSAYIRDMLREKGII